MTKQQHIDYWVNTAAEDWISVEIMFAAKRYLHCLFWSHLVLEKLAKAHWVKNHKENIPPKIHNVIWLLEESGVDLGKDTMAFLVEFNRFQLSTRYPDYVGKIYKICTEAFTTEELNTVKEIRQCLLKMLPLA
jgi:HEPN domain-containing protein